MRFVQHLVVLFPFALGLGCAATQDAEPETVAPDNIDVGSSESALSLNPGALKCGLSYVRELARVVATEAFVNSKSCKPLRDTSGLQPALSAVDWKCCDTANGPVCAGNGEIVEKEFPLDWIACGGGSEEILVDAKEQFKYIRIYNKQKKMTFRSQWSVTEKKEYYISKKGPRLKGFENWVDSYELAVPGDLSTATEYLTGLVEHVVDKRGRKTWTDTGRLKFLPNGDYEVECGTFESYDDYDRVNEDVCESLGSAL